MSAFSPEQAKVLLNKHALNLANKLKEGETLTAKEQAMLESIADGGVNTDKRFAKSQEELAELLGFEDRKTIQRLMKKPGHPETAADGRYDVAAWRAFAKANSPKAAVADSPDLEKEKAKNILLQNKRLEFQIRVLCREYVATGEVEKWGATLGKEIRNAVIALHKIASSLAGLSTAEIESRLREFEDDTLMRLHSWTQRMHDEKEKSDEEA